MEIQGLVVQICHVNICLTTSVPFVASHPLLVVTLLLNLDIGYSMTCLLIVSSINAKFAGSALQLTVICFHQTPIVLIGYCLNINCVIDHDFNSICSHV